MGAQHMRRAVIALGSVGIEGVHLCAGRVVPGHVECVKIIPIGFNLRPFSHGKSHIGKNCGDFFPDLGNWVDGPHRPLAPWQRDIQPFGLQTLLQSRIRHGRFARREGRINLIFQSIERRTGHLPLFGRHFTQ